MIGEVPRREGEDAPLDPAEPEVTSAPETVPEAEEVTPAPEVEKPFNYEVMKQEIFDRCNQRKEKLGELIKEIFGTEGQNKDGRRRLYDIMSDKIKSKPNEQEQVLADAITAKTKEINEEKDTAIKELDAKKLETQKAKIAEI